MIINNDKKNELTDTILMITRDQIKKGGVVGAYLNSYTIDRTKNIEITTVVEEITKEWEYLWDQQGYRQPIYAKVHNIEIFPTVITIGDFSKVHMHKRELLAAQELKNADIIYDVEETEEDKKLLADFQESFQKDTSLEYYQNRIEISPKLIKRIRQGIQSNWKIQRSRNIQNRIVNEEKLNTAKKIYQITDLLNRYNDFEKGDGFPKWDNTQYKFTDQYVVCDEENLRKFCQLQAKTTSFGFDLDHVFEKMKQSSINQFTEEEKRIFFGRCLAYLEEGFEAIDPIDYMSDGEKEIYRELRPGNKQKAKKRK